MTDVAAFDDINVLSAEEEEPSSGGRRWLRSNDRGHDSLAWIKVEIHRTVTTWSTSARRDAPSVPTPMQAAPSGPSRSSSVTSIGSRARRPDAQRPRSWSTGAKSSVRTARRR